MNIERIEEILNRIAKVKVGLIGDFCLDAYWDINDEILQADEDSNMKIYSVSRQRYNLGGAGNIAANIKGIGAAEIYAFGIRGDDIFSRELLNQMNILDVNTDGMIFQKENWDTPVYTKPFRDDVPVNRFDFGKMNKISEKAEEELLSRLEQALPGLDLLILNQKFESGIFSETVISWLNKYAADLKKIVMFADVKNINSKLRNISLKIDASEIDDYFNSGTQSKNKIPDDTIKENDVTEAAKKISRSVVECVFVSRASRGFTVASEDSVVSVPGIQALGRIDPVGAGDTATAAIAVSLAAGASPAEAAEIGNFAAAVTVRKLKQTGSASPEEIRMMALDADYVYKPELAEDIRKAVYAPDSEIEVIFDIPRGTIKHVIFDNDGTISVLRQGWEAIMRQVMIQSIMGDAYLSADENTYRMVLKKSDEFIYKSTGIQTIIQMEGLVEMIKDMRLRKDDFSTDPWYYKDIYNKELLRMVNGRLEKIQRGELDAADFVIKGSIEFLNALHSKGITLYLASGTDAEDVEREAEVLGFAHLFKGRIFGAKKEIRNAKRVVVEKILKEHNLKGCEFACIGDGPVELREAKRRDGIAIGIASDEVCRHGFNPEKRPRLIKGGADILIPDFSQQKKLLAMMFGE